MSNDGPMQQESRNNGQAGRGSDMAQRVFGTCEAKMGPKLMKCCSLELMDQRILQNAEKNSNSQRLVNKFEILRERGELPKQESDAVRTYKAIHEENFPSSWPMEDERRKEE